MPAGTATERNTSGKLGGKLGPPDDRQPDWFDALTRGAVGEPARERKP